MCFAAISRSVMKVPPRAAERRLSNPLGSDIGLQPGDLIHEINGKSVFSADELRTLAGKLQSGDSVALLVERAGQWSYLAFDMS